MKYISTIGSFCSLHDLEHGDNEQFCHVRVDLVDGYIPDPSAVVVSFQYLKLLVDWPLTKPVVVIVNSQDPNGFTNRVLFECIASTYAHVYAIEREREREKQRKRQGKNIDTVFGINTNEKRLEDLIVLAVNYNRHVNCITLKIACRRSCEQKNRIKTDELHGS